MSHVVNGVNIVGFFTSAFGIAAAGRHVVENVRACGYPYSTYNVVSSHHQEHVAFPPVSNGHFNTNIFCVNPSETAWAFGEVNVSREGSRNIGVWFWETEMFHHTQFCGFPFHGEIWMGSDFSRRAVQIALDTNPTLHSFRDRDVFALPISASVPHVSGVGPESFGMRPGCFYFTFFFDFCSISQRKNPQGVIDAFVRAFPVPGSSVALLIKSSNHRFYPDVRLETYGRSDIVWFDRQMSDEDKNALLRHSGAYVSLHRAEGLGLTLLESMMLGVSVVSTDYSSTREFVTAQNGWPVRYQKTRVVDPSGIYPEDQQWADPDIDDAAQQMRLLYDNPDERARRIAQALKDTEPSVLHVRRVKFIRSRLENV